MIHHIDIKSDPKFFFGYVVLRISRHWNRRKFVIFFAQFIERTYTDDLWAPSSPGPDLVNDKPPVGLLQFTV
jgi:hypothetical protein